MTGCGMPMTDEQRREIAAALRALADAIEPDCEDTPRKPQPVQIALPSWLLDED